MLRVAPRPGVRRRPAQRAHRRAALRLLHRPPTALDGADRRADRAPRPATRPTTSSLRLADGAPRRAHQHLRGQRPRRRRARRLRAAPTRPRPAPPSSSPAGTLPARRRRGGPADARRPPARRSATWSLAVAAPARAAQPVARRRRRRRRRARPRTSPALLGLRRASCPTGAEVISSIGDALSLVRAERERTVDAADAADDRRARWPRSRPRRRGRRRPGDARRPGRRAPEQGAVRVVATGAVALASGLVPGRAPVGAEEACRGGQGAAADPPGAGRLLLAGPSRRRGAGCCCSTGSATSSST